MAKSILTLFSLTVAVATVVLLDSTVSCNANNGNLVDLGIADGVNYFGEHERLMGWYSAEDHCRQNNMTLAKILTKNQARLIITNGIKEYWTAARYANLPTSYVWHDMPNTHPSEDVIDSFNLFGTFAMPVCAAVRSRSGELEMVAYLCSREYVYTLCQKDIGIQI